MRYIFCHAHVLLYDYVYYSKLKALKTSTSVEPSWIKTAVPMLANLKTVAGIDKATIPKLVHRFCLIVLFDFLPSPIAKSKIFKFVGHQGNDAEAAIFS